MARSHMVCCLCLRPTKAFAGMGYRVTGNDIRCDCMGLGNDVLPSLAFVIMAS